MHLSPSTSLNYQRLLVKLSGEALQGKQESGIDPHYLQQYTQEIAHAVKAGITIAIVVGGGNYCRGAKLVGAGIKRATADQMGILATLMNGLALRDALQQHDIAAQVMSAIAVPGLAAPFDRSAALHLLQQGTVVICVAGTGNPFFTTDTTASLRAIELEMQLLLKATRVDGVYSADPHKNPAAQRYQQLSYEQVLAEKLQVMDTTAIYLCQEYHLPIRVFDINKRGAILAIAQGSSEGTLISEM